MSPERPKAILFPCIHVPTSQRALLSSLYASLYILYIGVRISSTVYNKHCASRQRQTFEKSLYRCRAQSELQDTCRTLMIFLKTAV